MTTMMGQLEGSSQTLYHPSLTRSNNVISLIVGRRATRPRLESVTLPKRRTQPSGQDAAAVDRVVVVETAA